MAGAIRISAPASASRGEIIELKALIQHDMESGYRLTSKGEQIPRNILTKFECIMDGETLFQADFHPGVAANPFITFHIRAKKSGKLIFKWTEQTGLVFQDSAQIDVA